MKAIFLKSGVSTSLSTKAMILPKYRFYLGKSVTLEVASLANDSIEFNALSVPPGYIYIDYNPEAGAEELTLYKIKGPNNTETVQIKHAGLYTIESNVTSIILYITGLTDDAIDRHKDFTKYGFSNLYIIHDINPVYKKLIKKYAKENGQQFFRKSLDGSIKLIAKDYELAQSASIEQNMLFFVEKLNATTGEWYEYYKGQFSKTDCKFNFSKKVCEPKLSALDQYNNILDRYEDTYDLIKLAPAISKIDLCKRPLLQIYVRGESIISGYFGGTYWEDSVNEIIDDHDELINKYFFSYLKAGNEFSIEGASIEAVNGVYAGVNGVWKGQNGYTCYLPSTNSQDFRYIEVKRNSDNVTVYKSKVVYSTQEANNVWIGREDVSLQNVNNATDTCTIKNPIVYHVYQRVLCDVDEVSGIATHDIPYDDFVSDNKNYKKCIGISSGQFFCSATTSNKPTKYGVNDFNQYFTNADVYAAIGLRPVPIARNAWANASLWYVYNTAEYKIWEAKHRKKYTLNDSYSIAAVIKVLLHKIDPAISHEETEEYSQFLYGDTQIAPLKWDIFKVYITQKTNILKGQYDQAAQTAEITLKAVMEMLRDCFRCYWYIEDNKLKIEHISFFMNGGSYDSQPGIQLDFTKLTDCFNKMPASYFQSQIEFDKSELNRRYEFSWMDDTTELFGPVNIDVIANYIQQDKTDEISISNFSSDVDFMLFDPSNFSDDGFALLCPIINNSKLELPIITADLLDENGHSYEMTAQNWYASWPYLVGFYKYDMPAYNIDVDILAEPMIVNKIKRCMQHTIEVHTAEDPDELKLITTLLGNGYVENISVNLETRLAEITLVYEPV